MQNVEIEIALIDGKKLVLQDMLANKAEDKINLSRNIYLIDQDENFVWQIKTDFDAEGMPFTNLYIDENGIALAYRWDGGVYSIDLESGRATPKMLLK